MVARGWDGKKMPAQIQTVEGVWFPESWRSRVRFADVDEMDELEGRTCSTLIFCISWFLGLV